MISLIFFITKLVLLFYFMCSDSGYLYPNNFVIHANGASTSQAAAYKFPDVPEKHFAEQLTRMDMV